MPDIRVQLAAVRDEGQDGIFWRDGFRWLRENGRHENKLIDCAPNLEKDFIERELPHMPVEMLARSISMGKK